MAEAKVKEPTLREKVIYGVAQSLMAGSDLGEIPYTKEGLVLSVEDKYFVVKIIQKKSPIYQEDIKGMVEFAGEADTDTVEPVEEDGFDVAVGE